MKKAFIVNYDCGNIQSLKSWLLSCSVRSTTIDCLSDFNYITDNSIIILPGVGNFGQAINSINQKGFHEKLISLFKNVPILGICLGAQIMLSESEESPFSKGLNIIKGKTISLPKKDKPRIGWYKTNSNDKLLKPEIFDNFFYYNHSYYMVPSEVDGLITLESNKYCAGYFYKKYIVGLQFHPERSQIVGKLVLNNILNYFGIK